MGCRLLPADEDAAHVELDAVALLAVPQVERRVGGHVQQLGVFLLAFHLGVRQASGVSKSCADVLVERLVLLRLISFLGAPTGRKPG